METPPLDCEGCVVRKGDLVRIVERINTNRKKVRRGTVDVVHSEAEGANVEVLVIRERDKRDQNKVESILLRATDIVVIERENGDKPEKAA